MRIAWPTITKYSLALTAIVLLGLFLRMYHLGAASLWEDEAFSVLISKMGPLQIVRQAAISDTHPPLHYLLLHFWMGALGTSEVDLRLLSLLFGVASIPVIYLVGRELFDEEAGLIAALILAVSTFNLQYSQMVRDYIVMAFLALLSMYFFLRVIRHERATFALSAGYVLSTTLLLYSHFYGLFVLAAQNIYLAIVFFSEHRGIQPRRWVSLQAVVVVFFAPWVLIPLIVRTSGISTVAGGSFWLPRPTKAMLLETFRQYSSTAAPRSYILLGIFVGLSVFSLVTYRKVRGAINWKMPLRTFESFIWEVRIRDTIPVCFLVVWMLTVILVPYVIATFYTSIFTTKYTIAASLPFYLLAAQGIRSINSRYRKVAMLSVVTVLLAASWQAYDSSPPLSQAREGIGYVNANAKPGDLIIVGELNGAAWQYYNKTNSIDTIAYSRYPDREPYVHMPQLLAKTAGYDRVWLVTRETAERGQADAMANVLNESYTIGYHKEYIDQNVYLFEKRA